MLEVIDGVRAQAEGGVKNEALKAWVQLAVQLCEPKAVHWCDGSDQEYDELCQLLVDQGTIDVREGE